MNAQTPAVFRFAPSPNGELHLGHAYSALLNFRLARKAGGAFLLRIEDIDTERCRPDFEAQMLHDLEWVGIEWDGEPRRQSEHFDDYRAALETLQEAQLVYPAFMSRSAIRNATAAWGANWPTDPDGVPHYPGEERGWSEAERDAAILEKPNHTLRLDVNRAAHWKNNDLFWLENGKGPAGESGKVIARPQDWGDVVLGRSDIPTSYHLSVVIDDALQGVTHVVRGRDLFHATSVHRLLQDLLGFPAPHYTHHDLVLDENGRKLSKSLKDTSLRALRESGLTPPDIVRLVGLDQL